MADGSTIRTDGFIAYQDEEDGLGFQVASALANPAGPRGRGQAGDQTKSAAHSYRLTSPRRTAADTVAALIANDAQRAVLPLQNDRRGYSLQTLETLIDFKDYKIVEERRADDAYVLAVPSAMVYELGESAFPSAYGAGAVGALPRNLQTQTALRRRIDTVYATADAMDRCRAAVDGFRAQGMKVVRLPDNANPYRDVLGEAYSRLDPQREIETGFNEATNSRTRMSKIKGANYGKSLVGVLLPSDVAWLGEGADYHPDSRDVSLRDTDYVIVDQGLAGAKQIETHFLVLERKAEEVGKPEKKTGKTQTPAEKIAGDNGIVAGMLKPFAAATNRNVRVLLKVDTRGPGVSDTTELTDTMAQNKLPYTPVVLNDRPQTLPTVYEIAVSTDEDRKALFKVLKLASDPKKGWHARVLGTYPSERIMPPAPIAVTKSEWMPTAFAIVALVLAVAIIAMLIAFPEATQQISDLFKSAS